MLPLARDVRSEQMLPESFMAACSNTAVVHGPAQVSGLSDLAAQQQLACPLRVVRNLHCCRLCSSAQRCVVLSSSNVLSQDNTRIYYVTKGEAARIEAKLKPGATITLSGAAEQAVTAPGGDHLFIWMPDAVGYVGVVTLPERRQSSGEPGKVQLEATVVMVFDKPVGAKSLDAMAGLACNPYMLNVDFGEKVCELTGSRRDAKFPYDPESVLAALKLLWHGAVPVDRQGNQAITNSSGWRQRSQPLKRTKKRRLTEVKELNQDMMRQALLKVGFSAERAEHVLQHESHGWGMQCTTGQDPELHLVVHVYGPRKSQPVISSDYESVFEKTAQFWKTEYLDPKPPRPATKRYTRQQKKATAALEQRFETEGLNDIQKQQLQAMMAECLKPLADVQQQQKSTLDSIQKDQTNDHKSISDLSSCLQKLLPALQGLAHRPHAIGYSAMPAPTMANSQVGRSAFST
ncbi:TPA: hypothetical protein ACH3X2_000076 [Trebouxia sp. C0005]